MVAPHLAVYLNDHLAGSTAGLDLIEHLGTAPDPEIVRAAADLKVEVGADSRELEALMQRLAVAVSMPRQAGGWLAEKLVDLKVRLDDRAGGTFRAFELLEALSLGIEGKRCLWEALQSAAEREPLLSGLDYPRLVRRAQEQRQVVEALRIACARAALGAG
jgi:hypothetical protein